MVDWKQIWNGKSAQKDLEQIKDFKELFVTMKKAFRADSGEELYDECHAQYMEIVKSLGKYNVIKSVYEVGCGNGATLLFFKNDGYKVGGVDYSNSLISDAKIIFPDCDFTCDEAANIDHEIKYDVCYSNSVFQYFDSEEYAQTVMQKMLDKSRFAIGLIDIQDADKKEESMEFRKKFLSNYDENAQNRRFYTKQFFEDFAIKNNLKIEFGGYRMKGYVNADYSFSVYMYK